MTEPLSNVTHGHRGSQPSAPSKLQYLNSSLVVVDLCVASRKRLFQEISKLIVSVNPDTAISNLSADDIFNTLHERERLGSTAVGKGIAIPHGRVEGISEPIISITRLKSPIDYDAPDGVPVWFAVCLLVPEKANDTHLALLAALATLFNQDQMVDEIKQAQTADQLYRLFTRET